MACCVFRSPQFSSVFCLVLPCLVLWCVLLRCGVLGGVAVRCNAAWCLVAWCLVMLRAVVCRVTVCFRCCGGKLHVLVSVCVCVRVRVVAIASCSVLCLVARRRVRLLTCLVVCCRVLTRAVVFCSCSYLPSSALECQLARSFVTNRWVGIPRPCGEEWYPPEETNPCHFARHAAYWQDLRLIRCLQSWQSVAQLEKAEKEEDNHRCRTQITFCPFGLWQFLHIPF